MRKKTFLTTLLCLSISNSHAASLDVLPAYSGFNFYPRGISQDGSIVAGYGYNGDYNISGVKWTAAAGTQALDSSVFVVHGISGDGSTILGRINYGDGSHAVRITSSGVEDIDTMGNENSYAIAASRDGSTIVGFYYNGSDDYSFIWKEGTGMVGISALGESQAYDVSGDGSIVVGSMLDGSETSSFRWTQDEGVTLLDRLNGGEGFATANGISDDGSTIVGHAYDGNEDSSGLRAYKWDSVNRTVGLGVLDGDGSSYAFDVNSDGTVIVGNSELDGVRSRGFRWSVESGMQSVAAWLRDAGLNVEDDEIKDAQAVNGDGSVVVGTLSSEEGYYARVSSIGSGLITLEDLNASIQQGALSTSPKQVAGQARFTLHGMRSNPLSRIIPNGKTAAFVSGDIGRTNNQAFGRQNWGLGEAGFSHAFDLTQISLAFGQGLGNSNLPDAKMQSDNNYVMLSSLSSLASSDLYLNLDLLYQISDLESNRFYDNAGASDSSRGSTKAKTKALRARLDYKDLLTAGKFSLTPYIETVFGSTKVKAFREYGGGFPINFDSRKQNFRDQYLGTDIAYQLSEKLKLRAKFEYGKANEKTSATSGEVIGLSTFNYSNSKTTTSWRRAGAGFEYDFTNSRIFSMANASDEGLRNNYWVNVYYQKEF